MSYSTLFQVKSLEKLALKVTATLYPV